MQAVDTLASEGDWDRRYYARAAEEARPGDIVVAELGGSDGHNLFGAMGALGIKLRGVAGVIIDGGSRDLIELQDDTFNGFPVFARFFEQRKLTRRLQAAKLRYAASLEAVDFTHPRRLHRQQVLTLGSCAWITDHHNLLITGPTGIGKSFLACAFVERACRRGFTASYLRMPRLLHQLAVGRGDGSFSRLLTRLAKLDLLAIDDWLLAPLRDAERRDLTEVIEDRAERGSTLTSTRPVGWEWSGMRPSESGR